MAAAVGCLLRGPGPAAAGLTEFFWRRAFIPVAGTPRAVPVPLATRAGMQGKGFVRCFGLFILWLLCFFRHVFTRSTAIVP